MGWISTYRILFTLSDEASLAEIDIFTSSENLNIGVQIDNNASITSGGNNGRLEVTLGISDTPTFDSVTADSVTIGDAAAGGKTISQTTNGLSMGNSVLSGLADGTAATDAATVGQMNAADAMLRADIDTNTANIATNSANIATNTANIQANADNIATNSANIATNTANIQTNADNIATNSANIATNTANIQTNADNIATNSANIATNTANIATNTHEILTIRDVLGPTYDAPTFNTVTANSLTMGGYTMRGTASGFNMGGARLSGIADGGIYRGSTDAVTGNQLWNAYQRMDDLQESINVVGAHAAALSGLHPIDYNPYEPTTLSAAIGTYRDEYAVAVGVFHYAKENVMFNLGASLCSDGDVMGRAGVSFTVGKSSDKPKTPKNMNEVQAQLAQVQQALADLKAENEALKARLDEKD